MDIEVCFTPSEVDPGALPDRVAVVVDVIRATSTIVEALANGARAVYPTLSTEEALKLASSLGRDDTLLCGERRAAKIDGFDLGNSPAEFTRERVAGKRLIMTTTNGTRAFVTVAPARRVLAACFLNLGAVVGAVAREDALTLVCAGWEDTFSLDDAVCAGFFLKGLQAWRDSDLALNDGGVAALRLAERFSPDVDFLRSTAAGRQLVEAGFEDDLPHCVRRDLHALVPEMDDRMIRPGKPA